MTANRKFINILNSKLSKYKKKAKPYFNAVCLEYMRMPTAYTRQFFGRYFWSKVLVDLLQEDFISEITPIYVANFHDIAEEFLIAESVLENEGKFFLECEPCLAEENPLWNATTDIEAELESLGDSNTNATFLQSVKDEKRFMCRVFVQGIIVF
jgi:hypothetical protein